MIQYNSIHSDTLQLVHAFRWKPRTFAKDQNGTQSSEGIVKGHAGHVTSWCSQRWLVKKFDARRAKALRIARNPEALALCLVLTCLDSFHQFSVWKRVFSGLDVVQCVADTTSLSGLCMSKIWSESFSCACSLNLFGRQEVGCAGKTWWAAGWIVMLVQKIFSMNWHLQVKVPKHGFEQLWWTWNETFCSIAETALLRKLWNTLICRQVKSLQL